MVPEEVQVDLFAFWRHDQFPFVLGAPINSIRFDGCVHAPTFHGWFRPVLVLPHESGKELHAALLTLKNERQGVLDDVDAEYKEKLKKLMCTAENYMETR